MCGVCQAQANAAYVSNRAVQPTGDCIYSLEVLNLALSLASDAFLVALLTSQINTYNINCLLYVERINKRLQELNFPVLQA